MAARRGPAAARAWRRAGAWLAVLALLLQAVVPPFAMAAWAPDRLLPAAAAAARDGAATAAIHIRIPAGVVAVKPVPKPARELTTVTSPCAEPALAASDAAHGSSDHDDPADPAAGHAVAAVAADAVAVIAAEPARPGRNRLTVAILDAEGRSIEPREVTVALSLPSAGIEPIERRLAPAGGGRFAAEVEIPLAGNWQIRLDALVGDFEKAILRAGLPVGASPEAVPAGTGGPATIAPSAAWSRATPPRAATGVVYLTLANEGAEADRLLAVATPAAEAATLHATLTGPDGVARMQALDAVEIAPGAALILRPGRLHVMLHALTQPLAEGRRFPLTLTFARAGAVTVEVTVEAIGALRPGDGEDGAAD